MLFMRASSKFKKPLLGSRLVYSALLSQNWTSPTRSQHKGIMDLNKNKSDQPLWSKAYALAFKYTKSTRVMEFQLKFLHRRIATNDFLTKIGLENIFICDFWEDGKKGLAHLFWFCFKVSSIWNSLISRRISFEVLPAQYKLNVSIALGLRPDSSKSQHQSNFTCLTEPEFTITGSVKRGNRNQI